MPRNQVIICATTGETVFTNPENAVSFILLPTEGASECSGNLPKHIKPGFWRVDWGTTGTKIVPMTKEEKFSFKTRSFGYSTNPTIRTRLNKAFHVSIILLIGLGVVFKRTMMQEAPIEEMI